MPCRISGDRSNPAFAIAELINGLGAISNINRYSAPVFATIVNINIGTVNFGISAGYGEVSMTIRVQFLNDLDQLQDNILSFAQLQSNKEGLNAAANYLMSSRIQLMMTYCLQRPKRCLNWKESIFGF